MGKDCDQTTTVAPTPAESSPAITVLSIIFISMGCLYCLYILFKLIVWFSNFKKRKQSREKIEGYTKECDGCQKMKYFCACDKKKDDQNIDDKTSPSENTAIGFDNNLSYIKEEDEEGEEKAEEAIVGLEEDSNYNNTQSREEIKESTEEGVTANDSTIDTTDDVQVADTKFVDLQTDDVAPILENVDSSVA